MSARSPFSSFTVMFDEPFIISHSLPPLTVFSVGRMPAKHYKDYAQNGSLKGLRIGVVREYMSKKLFKIGRAHV